jgi:glycosyltransferase involved in cell wall biosynthesis
MSMTNIDVFIPVFNDIRFLPKAVASALGQTGVDVRVVVSDNASTDGTYEWIADAASRDNRIVVHRNERNFGHLYNLNRYRELVTAPHYMLLCSDDMLYRADALAKAAAIFVADPDTVSVYCDLAIIDAAGVQVTARRFGRSGPFRADEALRASLWSYRNMFGIPLLHRTEALKALSYPEGLTYAGDIQHSAMAARSGTLHHIPELLIGNRYTGGNMTAAVFRETRLQFARIGDALGVELGLRERLQRAVSYPLMMLSRKVFLAYMKRRARHSGVA